MIDRKRRKIFVLRLKLLDYKNINNFINSVNILFCLLQMSNDSWPIIIPLGMAYFSDKKKRIR